MTSMKGMQVREWIIAQLRVLPDEVFERWFDELLVVHTLDQMRRGIQAKTPVGEK